MKKTRILRILALTLSALMLLPMLLLTGCGQGKERIIIWTSSEDYRMADLQQRLNEKFPEYDILVEYKGTGENAPKLLAEGPEATEADIIHNVEYAYLLQLIAKDYLADVSDYDRSVYVDEAFPVEATTYMPQERSGGAIIINTERLSELGLPVPESYQDLLREEYKGHITMPSPKKSGTGYMFVKSLVNAWGDESAFSYFGELSENVLHFTSGSGVVGDLINKEAAIGLGMTAQAVEKIGEGHPLEVKFFAEGSPYTFYGQAIVRGKDERACVKEVFDYLINEYTKINNDNFYPEKIFASGAAIKEGFPADIDYSDMSGNTYEEKERILKLWDDAGFDLGE